MDILEYIVEEVQRQGHYITKPEGLWRVIWMLDAWRYAQVTVLNDEFCLQTIEELGKIVEPAKNKTGLRQCVVYVGNRIPPATKDLRKLLSQWWANLDTMIPLQAYKEFEMIHPFVDGNGRVGKIILNWKNKTLHEPIFPPKDLWGEIIANP